MEKERMIVDRRKDKRRKNAKKRDKEKKFVLFLMSSRKTKRFFCHIFGFICF